MKSRGNRAASWRNLRISAPANVRPRPMTATCTLVGRIASRPATTANAPIVAITLIASVPVSAAAARRIWTACCGVIVPSASSLETSTRSFIGQSEIVTNDQRSVYANLGLQRGGRQRKRTAKLHIPPNARCKCLSYRTASLQRPLVKARGWSGPPVSSVQIVVRCAPMTCRWQASGPSGQFVDVVPP